MRKKSIDEVSLWERPCILHKLRMFQSNQDVIHNLHYYSAVTFITMGCFSNLLTFCNKAPRVATPWEWIRFSWLTWCLWIKCFITKMKVATTFFSSRASAKQNSSKSLMDDCRTVGEKVRWSVYICHYFLNFLTPDALFPEL